MKTEDVIKAIQQDPNTPHAIKARVSSGQEWRFKSFKETARHFLSIYSAREGILTNENSKNYSQTDRFLTNLRTLNPEQLVYCYMLESSDHYLAVFANGPELNIYAILEKPYSIKGK
jgi:hypothetical protein